MTKEQAEQELKELESKQKTLWELAQHAQQEYESKRSAWHIVYTREQELLTFLRLCQ